ncbi:MAG: 8-oxoguanine DNA glycosylase [Firmicutes bacterium]|nr:8-oxoguanine DNA glycosylase [Bacillota bacterium]
MDYLITYKRNAAHAPVYGYAPISDINLRETFECGQCFRWRALGSEDASEADEAGGAKKSDGAQARATESYIGIARGHIARIDYDKKEKHLHITELGANTNKTDATELWPAYLDLNRDYAAIKRKLSRGDDTMKTAIAAGKGIRILKQDLWETIISFIISQNNNIPRIKGCIEKLAALYGEPIELAGTEKNKAEEIAILDEVGLTPNELPTSKVLAGLKEEDLAPVRLGYRARYLIETAKAVEEDCLPETFDDLNKLCGVGPKVANCIGLFGLGKMDSFPIDVWVRRVMSRMYKFDECDVKGMQAFAEAKFGDLGGFAQQYLFYYIRELEG